MFARQIVLLISLCFALAAATATATATAAPSGRAGGPWRPAAVGGAARGSPESIQLEVASSNSRVSRQLARPDASYQGAKYQTKRSSVAASSAAPSSRQLAEQQDGEPSSSSIENAKVQLSPRDLQVAAGYQHGKAHGGGKFYMFTEVPKKHAYKMGFKRGNHKHMIERKESVHKSHVHSHFKWHDKKGQGSHKWELKHYDHKKKKHHY